MDEQAIPADFPELRREHIQAVLGFAAERERRLSALPASGRTAMRARLSLGK